MSATTESARAARLMELVGANWTTQAIGAAVSVGVVEQLAQGASTEAALARATSCDLDALARLLRALAAIAIVAPAAKKGHWRLTPMGELLRADAPGSVRDWALWCAGPQWTLWGELAASVRTGRSARARAGAAPGYAHLDGDAESARLFHGAMAGLSSRIGRAIANAIDWSRSARVVDVGGGGGELLAEVLHAHHHLQGLILDLPHATSLALERLAHSGLEARCAVVTGSFFDELPSDADSYLLKSILHNWDDADALRILQRCHAALSADARLLLVERVLPTASEARRRQRAIVRSDLNMLVSLGGRERTLEDFARLSAEAKLSRPRRVATALDYSVLELRRSRRHVTAQTRARTLTLSAPKSVATDGA